MIGVSFEEYLRTKNILIKESTKEDIEITQEGVDKQLKLLYEFHKRSVGYELCLLNNLEHNIGKMYENQKMYCRVMQRHLKKIRENGDENICDQYLLKEGEKYIEFADECTKKITEELYFKIIRRSMTRREVSLGSIDFNNHIIKEYINIGSIGQCSYDLIEIDCIKLIQKLKRNKVKVDIDCVINRYCELEGLDEDSYTFIKFMSLYPIDFMRWCIRYKYDKKNMTPEKYKHMIKNALSKDMFLLGEGSL